MPEFAEWNSFYVIVGSAAGALIGLQFVVMTMIAQMPRLRAPEAGDAFATPSVIHFCVVLLLSAMISAPWHVIRPVSVVWLLVGLSGIAYTVVVARRMRGQTIYRPVFEDWLFHCLLPLSAYATLAAASYIARTQARPAMFVVGAATLLFLFVGIHNAWDAATYHIFHKSGESPKDERQR